MYPSRTKEAQHRQYLKDRAKFQKRYEDNKELYAERRKKYRQDPRYLLVYNAKARAKNKGLEFDLHYTDIEIPDVCPVLKIPLIKGDGKRHDGSPSIDRICNSAGYIKGNVAVISWRANKMKSNMTIDEIKALLNYMENKNV